MKRHPIRPDVQCTERPPQGDLRALPILVRQARAHRTMFYGELAVELGMSNPRNMNYPLGAVGKAMLDLAKTWGRSVPPIQALVVTKSTGLPGEGIACFAPDAKSFTGMSRQDRQLTVDRMLHEVFTYAHWNRVLEALGLRARFRSSTPSGVRGGAAARRG